MGRRGKIRSSSRGRRRGRRRRSVKLVEKDEEDRISELPDELIDHILSYVDSNVAVQTMVLSKRWVNLWTTLSCLNVKQRHPIFPSYENIFTNFLKNRDQQFVISKVTIYCDLLGGGSRNRFLTIYLNYALSHNVEHLFICNADLGLACYPCPTPINFACLKTLHIKRCRNLHIMDCWTLPSLTSLYLKECTVLVNFGIEPDVTTITINCPKLQSLTLYPEFPHTFIVSAPHLLYLNYSSEYASSFSARDGFPCIKQVHIDIWKSYNGFWTAMKHAMENFISMLKAVRETPYLELSSETIQGLRMITNLSEYQSCPLGNLEFISLRGPGLSDMRPPRTTEHVINYLLTNSPCAKIVRRMC